MREPSELGTVILARMRGESALTRWTYCGRGVWSREIDATRASWAALIDHELLHHGYTPPTPEPTLPLAVVRDGEGVLRHRVMDCRLAVWMRADGAGFCPWDEVPQEPNRVEILFPGVPDA